MVKIHIQISSHNGILYPLCYTPQQVFTPSCLTKEGICLDSVVLSSAQGNFKFTFWSK